MQSDTLLEPLIMGQGELFQHYLNRNMRQSTRTVNCKVATLRATSNSLITCIEHLSSAEHCIEQLNGGFDQTPSRGASTKVQGQTVEHTPRCAMRCPEWSAKHASFDPATLLLRPFPHGFLHAKVRSQSFPKGSNKGALRVVVVQGCDDLATKKHVFWSLQFAAKI
jgi:hypothetical protein